MNAEAAPDPAALWLCQLPGMTVPLLQQLLGTFGSAAEILAASSGALRAAGVAPALVAKFVRGAREVSQVAGGLKGLQRLGITPLPLASSTYPERLRELRQPPLVVYVQGAWPLKQRHVALLGSDVLAVEVAEAWRKLVGEVHAHVAFAAVQGASAADGVPLGLLGVPFGLMLARQRLPQSIMRQVAEGSTTLVSTVPPNAQAAGVAATGAEATITDVLLALSDALVLLPPVGPSIAPMLTSQTFGIPTFVFGTARGETLPPRVRRLLPGKAGARSLRAALGLNITGTQTVQQERLL